MEYRVQKPSNQNALPIDKAYQLNVKARQWVEDHPTLWQSYLEIARKGSEYGKMSPNFPVVVLRHICGAKIKTDYAPYLARIAKEQEPDLLFDLRKSRADGFCKVKL